MDFTVALVFRLYIKLCQQLIQMDNMLENQVVYAKKRAADAIIDKERMAEELRTLKAEYKSSS